MRSIPHLAKNHYYTSDNNRQEEDFQEKDNLIKFVMEHDLLLRKYLHHSKSKNNLNDYLKIFYYYMISFEHKGTV